MFHTCCVLIKLSLILCVLGAINIDNSNKTGTERKFEDLEASIVQNLNKLENNTLDRIITYYIDRKLDASNKKIEDNFENKITQAMTASNKKGEENLFNITQALNVFNKKMEENVLNTTQTFYVLNKKMEENIFNITQTFNKLNKTVEENFEKKITEAMNASNKKGEENLFNVTQELNLFNKKMEENVLNTTQTFYVLNKKMEENIFNTTQTFNKLNKTVEENFEKKITEAMDASNKKGDENLLNIAQTFNKKIEENFLKTTQTFISLNKKMEDSLEKKKAQISNARDSTKEGHKKNRTCQPCKEESLNSSYINTQWYSVDNETLNHATVQRDSAGRLTYFEMHVAIQADEDMDIWLKDKHHLSICTIAIGIDSNQYTKFYLNHLTDPWTRDQRTPTPYILSWSQFRTFYIKVDDETLQFGKEGDSTPLISHNIARYGSLQYFQFTYNGYYTSKIRYDCPHVPEYS